MGANTIRRYDPSIYDHNILNVAAEKKLKVLYGFWFEPGVNYADDDKILREYEEKVIKHVTKYRDHEAILGWSIGNEVWGLSKQYYAQPYLWKIRQHYVQFIEHLAKRIHVLDPKHPVFLSEEHSSKLPAAITDFREMSPSLDIIGVNSYYFKHIRGLQTTMTAFDPHRPYIVSEFGPEGYWQPDFTKTDDYGAVLEDGGWRKAHLYERRWLDQVQPFKGSNLGGIAYCWSDRLEGTATWFGLTDNKGNVKPAYTALQKLWTGKTSISPPGEVYIFSPEEALEPGKEYSFFAVVENQQAVPLTYEWYLCKDEFVQMKKKLDPIEGGRELKLLIPSDSSNYRLYVRVTNPEKVSNSASFPLPAFRKNIK